MININQSLREFWDFFKRDYGNILLWLGPSSMCNFNAVKKQSGIGFIVVALFGYFAYLNSLYTVVELHTHFVLIHFERKSDYGIENNI